MARYVDTNLGDSQMGAADTSASPVLNSWKEIATYLRLGVRTVQRYEHTLHLPVRRHHAKARSAVIALTKDLDDWLRSSPTRADVATTQSVRGWNALRAHYDAVIRLNHNLKVLMERIAVAQEIQ